MDREQAFGLRPRLAAARQDFAGGQAGFLERKAVVDPQGRLLNILRYHVSRHFGKAIVLNISPGVRSLFFDRITNVYGGITKFTIGRHQKNECLRVSGEARDSSRKNGDARCPDADWLFDGEDIILVSRMAYDGAHNYHDANHLISPD